MMKLKSIIKSPYFYFAALVSISAALLLFAKYIPGFAEVYYKTFYKYVGGLFGSITGIFPFSLMEAAFASAIFLLIYWIAKLVLKSKQGEEEMLKYFFGVLKKIFAIGCTVFFLFSAFCGTNYHTEGFAEKTGLEVKKSSSEELYELCAFLLEEAKDSGEGLLHDENGVTVFAPNDLNMAKRAKSEFEDFSADYDFMDMGFGAFGRPKPVIFSEVMAYLQISGVFSPYTFEANICKAGPDFLRGATMMHEQSHLRGFMNEAEANFIAYLACSKSDDDYFRYSGTCLALIYSMNALYSADYESWYELRVQYPKYLDADMRAQNAYIDAHDTKVAEVSDSVNDTYLKLNSQQDGVRSYGKMVDLLLAYRRSL